MNLTFKEYAVRVLEHTQKPMNDIEIWEYGVQRGWDKELQKRKGGKTPEQSLYAILSGYTTPDERIGVINSKTERRKFYLRDNQETIYPDEVTMPESELSEGQKKQVYVNVYERNPESRKRCIEHYGAICYICGFDSSAVYGDEFVGKIHIHHIKPLSKIGKEYKVDPINDLVPVCPNCHMILHSKVDGCYDVNEIKRRIDKK